MSDKLKVAEALRRRAGILTSAADTAAARTNLPSLAKPTPAVTGLIVAPGGADGEISLTWDASDTTVSHFEIFGGDQAGGPYLHLALVGNLPSPWWPGDRRGFQDVEQFEERFYVVRAVGRTGTGGPISDEASGTHVFRPH